MIATIYHEALHAYFALKMQELGTTEFNNRFLGLNVNGGRLLGVQDPVHVPMAYTNYVNGLRDAVLAFNPNFDVNRAYALALGGIGVLTQAQLLVNTQEKDTRNTGYQGSKCP